MDFIFKKVLDSPRGTIALRVLGGYEEQLIFRMASSKSLFLSLSFKKAVMDLLSVNLS